MPTDSLFLGTIPSTDGHEIGKRITVRNADVELQKRFPGLNAIGVVFERVDGGWKFVDVDTDPFWYLPRLRIGPVAGIRSMS